MCFANIDEQLFCYMTQEHKFCVSLPAIFHDIRSKTDTFYSLMANSSEKREQNSLYVKTTFSNLKIINVIQEQKNYVMVHSCVLYCSFGILTIYKCKGCVKGGFRIYILKKFIQTLLDCILKYKKNNL